MLVERVLGYNADGHALDVLFVDGVEVLQVTNYELDPDDPMIRYGLGGEWLERQHITAVAASPAAAELIHHWAAQTVEHGFVNDPDDRSGDGEVADAQVDAVDLEAQPSEQL